MSIAAMIHRDDRHNLATSAEFDGRVCGGHFRVTSSLTVILAASIPLEPVGYQKAVW